MRVTTSVYYAELTKKIKNVNFEIKKSSYFSYVVTPHLNCLIEKVQMRGHNICFYAEFIKNIPNDMYHQIFPLICCDSSSEQSH